MLTRASNLLRNARRVTVLTGAGISAESGVPTFRGSDGLWKQYRAEELATPEAFARDPRLVWEWYELRRAAIAQCEPNAAHLALAQFAIARHPDVRIVTQNVDALHSRAAERAAGPATRGDATAAMPLEVHGCIFRVRCTGCGVRTEHRDALDCSSMHTLPRCTACGAMLRPDVVWFGEMLDDTLIGDALAFGAESDVCLVVGTSALVYPAIGVALTTAEHGGAVIEVNPEPTPLTPIATISLRATACAAVPALLGSSPDPDVTTA